MPALSRISGGPPRSAEALIATAAWLPALALSRGGAFAASRALGLNLSRGYSKLTVLASRRIALSRLVALGALAFCFVLSRRSLISPGEALQFALCFQLVGVAPLLALALFKRASPVAGLITAGVVLVASVVAEHLHHPRGAEMVICAGEVGLGGLIAGMAYALVAPRRRRTAGLPADPCLDVPLDDIV